MKKTLLFFMVLALYACSNNDAPQGDGLPYFQFQAEDNKKILPFLKKNQILTFKNQKGNLLQFKIFDNQIQKRLEDRGTFVVGRYEYFHYDEARIILGGLLEIADSITENNNFYISIRRWPLDFDGSNYPTQSSPTRLFVNMGISPFGTVTQNLFVDYFQSTQFLKINNKTFEKVVKLSIEPSLPTILNQITQNFTAMYYDHESGIIGFDDNLNNEWRLQN